MCSGSTASALSSSSSTLQPHEQLSLPTALNRMLICLHHHCLPMPKGPWLDSGSVVQLLAASADSSEKDSRKQDDVLSSGGLYLICVGCSLVRCWVFSHVRKIESPNIFHWRRFSLPVTPGETLLLQGSNTWHFYNDSFMAVEKKKFAEKYFLLFLYFVEDESRYM